MEVGGWIEEIIIKIAGVHLFGSKSCVCQKGWKPTKDLAAEGDDTGPLTVSK